MTTIPATTLSPHVFDRGTLRKSSEHHRGLLVAAAVYLAVALVELSIIALAVPGIADISRLYVIVP
jgi:hypothetical protein